MNPFNNKFILDTAKNIRKFPTYQKNDTTVSETGEITTRTISTTKEYIKEECVELFINAVKNDFEDDLPASAFKLWNLLMLSYIDRNSDIVYYHYDDKVCNQSISRKTYYDAVKSLIAFKVIAKHERLPFVYYVNPRYFYNGDRLRIIKEIVKG